MPLNHLIQQSIGFFAPLKKELAYLDPGTGSFLLQLLLATALGGMFVVKKFWKNIKEFFKRLFLGKKYVKPEDVPSESVQPENVQPSDEPK
jgi:hypothetical protein